MTLGPQHDGGFIITSQMKEILDKPGLISVEMGSERLRHMLYTQLSEFNPNKLSVFALACVRGNYDAVKEAVDSGTAPDLNTTQSPFQYGFLIFTIFGARIRTRCPDSMHRHLDILSYLINSGAPLDIPDIFGYTALHHACVPPVGFPEIAKLFLEKGVNVNAQNRYGEVPICLPFQGGDVTLVNILMEHGADLDITDANGRSPRNMCIIYGAEVTAAVQRWDRKRKGEVAPWQEKRCENCKTKGSGLKQCAGCHVVRYCSVECQRAHWKMHRPTCNPFCAATTVTLKPTYDGDLTGTVSRADFTRQALRLAPPTALPLRPGLTKSEAENKSMVIKIQVPVDFLADGPIDPAFASLFIYNKRRDFVCLVRRASNPGAYDAVVQVVRSRGVCGAKAYFAAELKNSEALVVKISEVLAEQPF